MIGVLIGSIILAAAVQSGRPRPEPVLTDPASVDYGFSLSPDGRQAFYTHANPPERTERHLYRAEMLAGQIVNASPLLLDGKTVPGGDVQIAPDGERLVFYSRDLPAGGVQTLMAISSWRTARRMAGVRPLPCRRRSIPA